MMVNNLAVSYIKKEDGRAIFRSENGLEIALDESFVPDQTEAGQTFYLALDENPLVSSNENKKDILNKLLNDSEK